MTMIPSAPSSTNPNPPIELRLTLEGCRQPRGNDRSMFDGPHTYGLATLEGRLVGSFRITWAGDIDWISTDSRWDLGR